MDIFGTSGQKARSLDGQKSKGQKFGRPEVWSSEVQMAKWPDDYMVSYMYKTNSEKKL